MEENITEAAENIVEIAAIWREGTLQSRRGISCGTVCNHHMLTPEKTFCIWRRKSQILHKLE